MKFINILGTKNQKAFKYLQETNDKYNIETGYYNLDEHIVCISTQTGCQMGCLFCASNIITKNKGLFPRNLSKDEIVDQVKNVLNQQLKTEHHKRILFSFMGIGEPFLNYENVIASINLLAKEFPNSRATVSTIGIAPEKMKDLANLVFPITLKLHLSLHSPNDKLRKRLLPKAGKIKPALEALKYFSITRGITSKISYLLIKEINDTEKHAFELAKLLKQYPFIVKLSSFNPYNHFQPSEEEKFDLFEKILNSNGIQTCRFVSIGTEINAGCGQFKQKKPHS